MSYTYFSYSGKFPEQKGSGISTSAGTTSDVETCAGQIINALTKKANDILCTVNDAKRIISIMRDGDTFKFNSGHLNMTIQIVEVLEINHNDDVILTDSQISRAREMIAFLGNFAKKYKDLTLSNVAVMFTDIDKENNVGNAHKILKIVAHRDNRISVVSYDTIEQKYYVSRLTNWSYDMIYSLYTNIKRICK